VVKGSLVPWNTVTSDQRRLMTASPALKDLAGAIAQHLSAPRRRSADTETLPASEPLRALVRIAPYVP
jgi:hypothetical protein